MKIKGDYIDYIGLPGERLYSFWISDHHIPENQDFEFIGEHKNEKTNVDVHEVQFANCLMTKIPQGLTKTFPNLKMLNIFNSKLKNVCKNELIEYKYLDSIYFEGNEIEYLPGDLFEDFNQLRNIRFPRNQLKLIDPNILNGIYQLNTVDFRGNPNYDKCYSKFNYHENNATLEEIRLDLHEKYYSNPNRHLELEKNKNQEPYRAKFNLIDDIKRFLVDDSFKDFKVTIDDHEIPVHKFLLAARSPTLAELLKTNPEVENLNLIDISIETFEIILKFLYTDELPGDDSNFLHLFAAAGKLKIEELLEYSASKLIAQIDENNALDILKVSNKYNHMELRQKAFKEIKKKYPNVKFREEWAADTEKLMKIIEIIWQREEVDRKMNEELQKLGM